MIYRQIMMNTCIAYNLMMQWENKKNSYWFNRQEFCIYLYISIIRSLLHRILVRSIIDLGQSDEVGPLFLRFEGRDKPMSDYELIMLLLQVITVVIAFGALIALICLTKDKQPFISTNLEISINEKAISQNLMFFEMRLTQLLV